MRPLPVLRQAFELVLSRVGLERDYTYACDMLKSSGRTTVQHLAADGQRSAFALEVYGAHARMALEAADLFEYAACQAQLIPLHATCRSASAAEFGAYRLLHAATMRTGALGGELRSLGALAPRARRRRWGRRGA